MHSSLGQVLNMESQTLPVASQSLWENLEPLLHLEALKLLFDEI